MGTGNYSATSNNMKLVHWPLMVGCYIWYSEEGPGWDAAPRSPLLAVPNITAHPSTASVPITVLLYNGRLLCGFNVNVIVKGLTCLKLTTGRHVSGVWVRVCVYTLQTHWKSR